MRAAENEEILKIGQRLKQIRKQLGLTQSDVADEFEIGVGTISEYENGRYEPPLKLIVGLAQKAGKDPMWIIFGDEHKPMPKPYRSPEDAIYHEISERLHHARNQAKLSLLEVGHRLKIDPNTVQQFERGELQPDIDYIARFAQTIGINLSWLVFGGDLPIFMESEQIATSAVHIIKDAQAFYSNPKLAAVIAYLQANPEFLNDIHKIIEGRLAAKKLTEEKRP